ncbi:hypothetical protein T439DRAFT_330254 [Meredithblackwellia eburnea MCA 4105]
MPEFGCLKIYTGFIGRGEYHSSDNWDRQKEAIEALATAAIANLGNKGTRSALLPAELGCVLGGSRHLRDVANLTLCLDAYKLDEKNFDAHDDKLRAREFKHMDDVWKQLEQLAKAKLIPKTIKMFAHSSAELAEPLLEQAHKLAIKFPHITIQFRIEHNDRFYEEDFDPEPAGGPFPQVPWRTRMPARCFASFDI